MVSFLTTKVELHILLPMVTGTASRRSRGPPEIARGCASPAYLRSVLSQRHISLRARTDVPNNHLHGPFLATLFEMLSINGSQHCQPCKQR